MLTVPLMRKLIALTLREALDHSRPGRNALFDNQGNQATSEQFVEKTDWAEVVVSRVPVKDAVRKKPGSGGSRLGFGIGTGI